MYFIKYLQEAFVAQKSIEEFRLWLKDLLLDDGKRNKPLLLVGHWSFGKLTVTQLVMVLVGLEYCFSVPFDIPRSVQNTSWFEKILGSLDGKRLGVGEVEPRNTMFLWLKCFLGKEYMPCRNKWGEHDTFQPDNTFIFFIQNPETSEMLKDVSLARRSLIIHTKYSTAIDDDCLDAMLGEVEEIREWALTA